MATDDALGQVMKALEEADQSLAEALSARAAAVRAFAELRQGRPDSPMRLPTFRDVMARLRQEGITYPEESLGPVVREILSGCERMIEPVTVVVPGPRGGFADGAARAYFGHAAELEALETVALVVDEVARGRARYGVVPFETTSDGAVTATLMALVRSDVKICAELSIPASHQLASATGNGGDIEKIYGSTVALADCDRQVRRRFPQATLIDVPSGEMAAHFAREDHGSAALLPAFSAKDHGLVTIEERMEDEAGVEIRFAIVGAEHPFRTGTDRTVLAVALQDEPGALHASLRVFAERNVNLTRVESRPAHGAAWRYFFFLELDGHMTDRVVLAAVEELRSSAPFVKVLGSYPRPA